jgi:hypothetical protein
MIRNYTQFNREEISAEAIRRFSYPVVGKQLDELYQKIIDPATS